MFYLNYLAKNLGEKGIGSFDFFFDGSNFYSIECNLRFTFGGVLQHEIGTMNLLTREVVLKNEAWE